MSSGWNPMTGRDARGTRPPLAPFGAPIPSQGQAYVPHSGGPGYTFASVPQYYGFHPPPYVASMPPGYATANLPSSYGIYTQQTYAHQPNGQGNIFARQPQAYPNIDMNMPAAQMTNTSGGIGCEPGYNYFFPAEHTKVHVFRTNIAPWKLPTTAQIPFKAAHVPCNTTMADLLKGFGCTNPNKKKNFCYEVIDGGSGKWFKGIEICGSDKDMMKKTLKEVGWDATRSGLPHQKPVVCLWFVKD